MKAVTARPSEDAVDLPERIRRQFNDSAQLKLKAIDALAGPIARAAEIMVKCLLANGKILACGNGGSAADARHLHAHRDRERLRIRAGVLQAAGRPGPGGGRASRDFHQRQLEKRRARRLGGPRARDARGRPHRPGRRRDRQAAHPGRREHLLAALPDRAQTGTGSAHRALPVRRDRFDAAGSRMRECAPRRWAAVALLVLSATALQACVDTLIVGGMTTGVILAADRRPLEVMLGDRRIESAAGDRIDEALKDAGHINVTSYNYTVLLTGEVPQVKTVVNELQVAGTSSAASRGNDAYITSKVKSAFLGAGKFRPTDIKVVTEAGVVHLLGLVTREEADAATEVARGTTGVLKVV